LQTTEKYVIIYKKEVENMPNLEDLLQQIEEDSVKYYILKGRDLYTEDEFSVLQNDNRSTQIQIYLPTSIGGTSISRLEDLENYNFYIDYIDGAGKPGVITGVRQSDVEHDLEIEALYKQDKDGSTYEILSSPTDYTYENGKITIDGTQYPLSTIANNHFKDGEGNLYYIKTNTQYIIDGKTYSSKVKNENFEDSAEISLDYDNPYSDAVYFIKSSEDLSININNYLIFNWNLNQQVTNATGEVVFSVRIEDNDNQQGTVDFKWQSNTATFTVKPNLQENYYLKKEVEENYVIQNRKIKPVGNFDNILVKGDTNSNKLFYKMNRYFQGQDMLAMKTFNDYDVYKNANGVFSYKNGSSYTLLSVIYNIEDIAIWRDGVTGSYDPITKTLSIDGHNYTNLSLRRVPVLPNPPTYKYSLQSNSTEIASLDSLNSIVTLNNNEYRINISAIGNGFAATGLTSTGDNGWVPVFNRLIRFVFMSPNGDYGDWNNGEIEYINDEEDYFIFSWTPDSRATRSEGDLSYYIEFFINGNYEEVLEDTGTTTVRSKSYSWSTLPTTIRVENNRAASPSVNYIPHWVSYVENNLQDDMDSFLNNDLQSQYNALAEYFINAILGDYTYTSAEEESANTYIVVLGDTIYNIEKIQSGNSFSLNISNETMQQLITVDLENLSESSIYGAAAQINPLNLNELVITDIIYNNHSVLTPGSISSETITIVVDGVEYTADIPTEPVPELDFTDADEHTITCKMRYQTTLINNYFIIYNDTLNRIDFYDLENENGITVPFLQAAQERLDSWSQQAEDQRDTIQTNYNDLRGNIVSTFGLGENITPDMYSQIWSYFDSLGKELYAIYDNSNSLNGTFKIIDNQGNEYNVVDGQTTIDQQNYLVKNILVQTNAGQIRKVEIETALDNFYMPGKYYYLNDGNYILDNGILTEGRIYYSLNKIEPALVGFSFENNVITLDSAPSINGVIKVYYNIDEAEVVETFRGDGETVSFTLVTTEETKENIRVELTEEVTNITPISFTTIPLSLDGSAVNGNTIFNSVNTYYATINTLSLQIQQSIAAAQTLAKDAFNTKSVELEDQNTASLANLTTQNAALQDNLQNKYTSALTDFYNTWSAEINASMLNQIATLEEALDNAINKKTNIVQATAQANTLIITPNQNIN
jgi:hypothetical protein